MSSGDWVGLICLLLLLGLVLFGIASWSKSVADEGERIEQQAIATRKTLSKEYLISKTKYKSIYYKWIHAEGLIENETPSKLQLRILEAMLEKEVCGYVSPMKEKEALPVNAAEIVSESLYAQWVRRTGNPKNITEHEFQIFVEKDLIKELKYLDWRRITGRKITKDEFEALKLAGAIKLYY